MHQGQEHDSLVLRKSQAAGEARLEGVEVATNTGQGFRRGEVRQRSQVENPKTGDWVKRDAETGRFTSVKREGGPFKGIKREK